MFDCGSDCIYLYIYIVCKIIKIIISFLTIGVVDVIPVKVLYKKRGPKSTDRILSKDDVNVILKITLNYIIYPERSVA